MKRYSNTVLLCCLLLINITVFAQQSFKCGDILTDSRDGQVYKTIKIGNQCWMAENLKASIYLNNDSITNVTDSTEWSSLKSGAWCSYNNDDSLSNIYGKLYNWYSVNNKSNICPSSWLVPDSNAWSTLINYLGGEEVAGGMMKEAGTTHWSSPNTGATNASGFSAYGAGYRGTASAKFIGFRLFTNFWSATSKDNIYAKMFYLNSSYADIIQTDYNKTGGFSVRCLMESGSSINEKKGSVNSINIYPNPASDVVIINTKFTQLTAEIYNLMGQTVSSVSLNPINPAINISDVTDGIYFIMISNHETATIQKLIVKH